MDGLVFFDWSEAGVNSREKPTVRRGLAIVLDDAAIPNGRPKNSYDRSLAVGLTLGSRVFCCDNLAFSGEVTMHRKHTVNVFRDLPDLIYRMLSKVAAMRVRTDGEIAAMKDRELQPATAHHLMVQAIRSGVLPASRLPKIIEAWEEPAHAEFLSRTAWSLFNAFTEVAKTITTAGSDGRQPAALVALSEELSLN